MNKRKLRGAMILVDRMRRLHPDVYQRFLRGEFPSIYRAAVEAGVMQEQFSVPRRPDRMAAYLRRRLSTGELEELVGLLEH